jgi:hypothetical protein
LLTQPQIQPSQNNAKSEGKGAHGKSAKESVKSGRLQNQFQERRETRKVEAESIPAFLSDNSAIF